MLSGALDLICFWLIFRWNWKSFFCDDRLLFDSRTRWHKLQTKWKQLKLIKNKCLQWQQQQVVVAPPAKAAEPGKQPTHTNAPYTAWQLTVVRAEGRGGMRHKSALNILLNRRTLRVGLAAWVPARFGAQSLLLFVFKMKMDFCAQ